MTEHPHLQAMKDAAYQRWLEEGQRRRDIEAVVLGRNSRDRMGDVVTLGPDHVVEVISGSESMWTTVVGEKPAHQYHHSQEEAVLHLIARRYNGATDSAAMAFAAGRVLGLPARDN